MASRGKLMLELSLKKRGYAWGEYKSSGTDGDVLNQEVPDDRLIEKDTSEDISIYEDQSFSPNYENVHGFNVVDDDMKDIYEDRSFSPNYENAFRLSAVDDDMKEKTEDGIGDLLENVNSILSGFPANINDYQETNRVMNNNEIDFEKEDSMELLLENDESIIIPPEDNPSKGSKSSKRRKISLKSTHPLRPPCKCKNICSSKFSEIRRRQIHEQFWGLPKDEQNHHLFKSILTTSVSRRRPRKEEANYKRSAFRKYHMKDEYGNDQVVCKVMFLGTFGYKSDKVLSNIFACNTPTKIKPMLDRRGSHNPKHKMSEAVRESICLHIAKFNPCVSHYRRKHAPNRLYLPSELNMKIMYDDFSKEFGEKICCYKSYRNIVKKMNISFTKLGEEICEVCREFELHNHDNNRSLKESIFECDEGLKEKIDDWACNLLRERNIDISENCDGCMEWKEHALQAKVTRMHYQNDKETNHSDNKVFYAGDMEKVIMLPRLPGMKKAIFTRRIILFNETFSPLGGKNDLRDTIAVLWHEGVSGRNDEDLASTITKVLYHPQNEKYTDFTFWFDNCAAQNKNWTLYSALISEINLSDHIQKIRIKYFEKGHTFMAADSFHHQVEEAIKKRKFLYNFSDFVSAVQSKGKVDVMLPTDFKMYTKELSYGKKGVNYPLLATVREVMFKRGSTKMHWKTDLREHEYKSGEFAKKKY